MQLKACCQCLVSTGSITNLLVISMRVNSREDRGASDYGIYAVSSALIEPNTEPEQKGADVPASSHTVPICYN